MSNIKVGTIIEYEQHSKPILAVIIGEKKGKWSVINQDGAQLDLSIDRFTALSTSVPEHLTAATEKSTFLTEISKAANQQIESIYLDEVWSLVSEEQRCFSLDELVEIVFPKAELIHYLAVRRALVNDRIYFKRRSDGFESRSPEAVEELKKQANILEQKQKQRELVVDSIIQWCLGKQKETPSGIFHIEELAALGSSAPQVKESKSIFEEVLKRCKFSFSGSLESSAFNFLVHVGHFDNDENLLPIRLQRPTAWTEEELKEAQNLCSNEKAIYLSGREDLRYLQTITIDGDETLDFDDAVSLEETKTGFIVGIHIADVSCFIPPNSVLEKAAFRRATSIYCADKHYPMLPINISQDVASLKEGEERPALSFLIEYDNEQKIVSRSIKRSVIVVSKRLTYDQADDILCNSQSDTSSLHHLLNKLWNIASSVEERRFEAGAIQFDRREMNAKLLANRKVTLQSASEDTPAHRLVSELMILANETAALFASNNDIPLIFRSQEPPDCNIEETSLGIPEGPAREYFMRGLLKRSEMSPYPSSHFGLGLNAYTQVTSPIRRAVDLISQRQITQYLIDGKVPYSHQQVTELIAELELGQDEAVLIQRERNKYWLLKYLMQETIRKIQGVIVRNDGLKPLAELEIIYSLFPFFPAKNTSSNNRLELGKKILLSVEKINPQGLNVILKEI